MKKTFRHFSFLTALMAASLLAPAPFVFPASTEGKAGLLPLNAGAPDFSLVDVVSGKRVSRDDFAAKKALLVMFVCRHCPYVQHVVSGLSQLGKDYAGEDVAIVAISSNDPNGYPDDSPGKLKEMAEQQGFNFPLLFDEEQNVGHSYTAIATPDFFLFDKDRKLVYRGQFDDSRPGKTDVPVTGKDVRNAIDSVLADKPVSPAQKPAVGCSIKWKSGNEPAYLR